MAVQQLNLDIVQGATFTKVLHWYGGGKVCKGIEDLTPGCPTAIQVTGHGLPSISDTPVFISRVKGATRANTDKDEPVLARYVDANNFTIDTETVGQTYTAGTGLLTYYAPKDLTDYSARMQIRETVESSTTIASLTSGAGDITISAADGKITITIADSVTETYDFDYAVYDLELEDASGVVTRLVEGTVELLKEVTR